jgi:hypothetical protein
VALIFSADPVGVLALAVCDFHNTPVREAKPPEPTCRENVEVEAIFDVGDEKNRRCIHCGTLRIFYENRRAATICCRSRDGFADLP